MSTTLDGTGIFTDNSENQGIVNTGVFDANAVNSGTVTTTAEFSGNAANHGDVIESAVFTGSAVNTGTVATAVFLDSAANAGTVTVSAEFADTSTNSGTISGEAVFTGSAVNDGGVVGGNAIFADTTTNNGTVQGDAQVAATATNSGTVAGTVTEYVPPVTQWYADSSPAAHAVTIVGTVTQSVLSGGVKAASFDGSSYLQIDSNAFEFGSDDFTIELFVKLTSPANDAALITTSAPNDNQGILLVTGYDGTIWIPAMYFGSNGGWSSLTYALEPSFISDTWTHIAFVRSGSDTKLFFNGTIIATASDSSYLPNSNNAIYIGGGRGNITGEFAAVRIVKGSALYSSNFSVPTTLPTAVTGTELLLNFGATNPPAV